MRKIFIYLFILMISNIYAQCDDYNEFNCSNEDSCEWVDIPTETGSCSALSLSVCDLPEYGPCYSYCTNWGYYYNCTGETYCIGGLYEIDNSYCQEIEMPECSAMNESECSSDNSCDWIENIEEVTCASLVWDQQLCEAAPECTYWCDDGGGYFGWCDPYCGGGMTYIDSSYCQEVVYELGDINQDNIINIQDVVIVIHLILDGEINLSADLNLDGSVDVLDVIQLVNIILN